MCVCVCAVLFSSNLHAYIHAALGLLGISVHVAIEADPTSRGCAVIAFTSTAIFFISNFFHFKLKKQFTTFFPLAYPETNASTRLHMCRSDYLGLSSLAV